MAQDLFTTEGYHHVSMDDIAARANVSKPVLYRHFPSKLDLYLAIVDARGTELLAAIDEAVRPFVETDRGDGRAVVQAIVGAYITFVGSAGEASALLFESDVAHDPDVRERVESASHDAARRIADALTGTTDLEAGAARLVAAGLVAMAQGAAIHTMRHPDGPSRERTADVVSRLVWRGVAGFLEPEASRPTT